MLQPNLGDLYYCASVSTRSGVSNNDGKFGQVNTAGGACRLENLTDDDVDHPRRSSRGGKASTRRSELQKEALVHEDQLELVEKAKRNKCLVVANLPKAKLGGVDSFGMVLCGSKDDKGVVEILEPPADCEDGERAFVDGYDGDAATTNQVKKKKLWPPIAENLGMTGGVATYAGDAIQTSEGPCKCASVEDGMLS